MKKNWICNWMLVMIMAIAVNACNDDDDIIKYTPKPPTVSFDSEDYIYKVKVGQEISILPVYGNNKEAAYSWEIDEKKFSDDSIFTHTFPKEGAYMVAVEVTTPAGNCREEIRIEVARLVPPVISLAIPENGLDIAVGKDYYLEPDIQNVDSTSTFLWKIDGKEAGNEKNLKVNFPEAGTFRISLYAENEDGNDTKEFNVNAIDYIPVKIVFPAPMYNSYDNGVVKYTSVGRPVFLAPYLFDQRELSFQWKLDGKDIEGATGQTYAFTPKSAGEYRITLYVTDKKNGTEKAAGRNINTAETIGTSVDVKIVCVGESRNRGYSGDPKKIKVHEFVAAPGQFVNDYGKPVNTMEEAVQCAQERLETGNYISLGGFGGYLTVSFDHSIKNIEGQYNFSIRGNQFENSSEPGIVWVSQDVNGDGLPNDEWFELKGCGYGNKTTRQTYAVTYYRPEGPGMNVPWQDNEGKSGCIDYLKEFHTQPYYYPDWIKENSYTLFGTCLEARNYRDMDSPGEMWINPSYEWGYADNYGSDMINGSPYVGFKISNAIYPDGTPANLEYIDFIKVVNGLNSKSGWIGELSTEVLGFNDENLAPTK